MDMHFWYGYAEVFISAELSSGPDSMCQLMIKAKKLLVKINSESWAYDTHN